MLRLTALLTIAALLAATPALAQRGVGRFSQGAGASRELLAVCGVDLRAYCSGVQPGGGRIAQCIRQNWNKLSPACQKTILSAPSGAPAAEPKPPPTPATPPN